MTDAERTLWLQIEAVVGDSEIELADFDDGAPALGAHEPSEAELDELAATVAPAALAAQRKDIDAMIRDAWRQARETKPVRHGARPALSPDLPRAELVAMVAQLHARYPQQFAQHYRNLDEMTDENLRALLEDMLALIDDEPDEPA